MTIEQGQIQLETPLSTVLDQEVLAGFFVFRGHDYRDQVTIGQLLDHTSGINDYFESKTMDGSKFIDEGLKTQISSGLLKLS